MLRKVTQSMNNKKLISLINRHEAFLQAILNETEIPSSQLQEAFKYILFPGGKRIRPLLVYLSGEIISLDIDCLDIIAAAIEILHGYSLVHDDLPAMDNDDFRRGKPSCHKAFDEATAILAGDGLQSLSIHILLDKLKNTIPSERILAVVEALVSASGVSGMVSGQMLDLMELSTKSVSQERLQQIHYLKTGKLIIACINMGLAARNIEGQMAYNLQQYAQRIGLAFQMQDDYLDRYGPKDLLGKNRYSDKENQKITYATIYNKKDLADYIDTCFYAAKQFLYPLKNAESLLEFTDYLAKRSQNYS
jgi:farnesyl diphosphate synthase